MINLLNAVITGAIPSSIEDEEAVEAYISTQNVSYFNLLYQRYSRKVYAKCYSMLKDDFEAEDAMQEIFMKILIKISTFSGRSKFSTWLYSITYNFCIDKIRMAKKDVTQEVDDINRYGENVADEVEDAELKEIAVDRLKVILGEINSEDKAVLLMKYQDDLSIKDMCVVLNKSESAMKMQIKRAKERFMKIYYQKYG
jgi:RNA polymerase sigma factor (sigma-70 family)